MLLYAIIDNRALFVALLSMMQCANLLIAHLSSILAALVIEVDRLVLQFPTHLWKPDVTFFLDIYHFLGSNAPETMV